MKLEMGKTVKSDTQKEILWEIFEKYSGAITNEVREEAVKRTGLQWRKIYKWIFDQGLRFKNDDR